MKHCLLVLLILSCGGEEFTTYEQGNNTPDSGSGGGEVEGGRGELPTSGGPHVGGSSSPAGGSSGGPAEAGSSGAAAMAGGQAMGEGGTGGEGGSDGLRVCLAYFQNLDCARVCTNSASDCQAVLSCFVQHNSNSLDNCSNFTTVGISLAQSAERNCCHD